MLNEAQAGLFDMENASALPSGSEAVGWNEYPAPIVALVPGMPEIFGAWFVADFTLIENAGSDALDTPSETRMMMLLYFPMCDVDGVPPRRPDVLLNHAQAGLFEIEKVSVLPSGSEAVGRNEYVTPTVALVAGAPDMTGGLLAAAEGAEWTRLARARRVETRIERDARGRVKAMGVVTPSQPLAAAAMHGVCPKLLGADVQCGRRRGSPYDRSEWGKRVLGSCDRRPVGSHHCRQPRYPRDESPRTGSFAPPHCGGFALVSNRPFGRGPSLCWTGVGAVTRAVPLNPGVNHEPGRDA